jgi:hypothetical protein
LPDTPTHEFGHIFGLAHQAIIALGGTSSMMSRSWNRAVSTTDIERLSTAYGRWLIMKTALILVGLSLMGCGMTEIKTSESSVLKLLEKAKHSAREGGQTCALKNKQNSEDLVEYFLVSRERDILNWRFDAAEGEVIGLEVAMTSPRGLPYSVSMEIKNWDCTGFELFWVMD